MKRSGFCSLLLSPFVLAVAGTLLFHVAAAFFLDVVPFKEGKVPVPEKPFVLFADVESVLAGRVQSEQAALLDSAPLFLPSRWNTTSPFISEVRRGRLDDVFDLFLPEFFFGEADLVAGPTEELREGEQLRNEIFEWSRDFLNILGRRDGEAAGTSGRAGLLEIIAPGSEHPVVRHVISRDATEGELSSLWAPAEFSLIIDSVGMIGPPLLLQSSGQDHVDQLLGRILTDYLLEHGRGLDPGYYRVLLGP